MTSSVAMLFEAASLQPQGAALWGSPVPEGGPGVYAVALSTEATDATAVLPACPIDPQAIEELLSWRPELRLHGKRPTAEQLAERVSHFWLPSEVVLYVGLAGTSLRTRVRQYYRTPLGDNKPHAGGWFLKLLDCLGKLTVYFAACDDPKGSEFKMIEAFCHGVSDRTRAMLADPEHPFPFANLEWPRGTRKRHGITGAAADPVRGSAGQHGSVVRHARTTSRMGGNMPIHAVNEYIQQQLRIRGEESVTAVEAARWLDEAGLLKDSQHRPGLPLRNLLRAGRIKGQRQELSHRWLINRV